MPGVVRDPAEYAVHTIYMVPSDYVLRDRFGVQQDEAVFMQRVEDQVLLIQQWYWDVLAAGRTFNTVPATWFRSALTTAQIFATYATYYDACLGLLQEMSRKGYYDLNSRGRLPNMYMPLDLEGAGNAIPSWSWGNPYFPPGGVVGAGQGGRLFGGLLPYFRCTPTTVDIGVSIGATAMQVAAGTGKNFATAGSFHYNSTRVTTAPSPATSGTTLVVDDLSWIRALPFDAVVWPYGPNPPAPSNAEMVRVTAINSSTNTLTVVRGQGGTTPIAIQGGSRNGGYCISQRNRYARVWTPTTLPEAPTTEVVEITSIGGDVLTIVRGTGDAFGSSTQRVLQPGDPIAVTDGPELWFYQKQAQATGAFAHELGHCFGMKQYTPAEARAYQYVSNGVVLTRDRIALNEVSDPSVDVAYGYGFWEHLRHTPDNPATPNLSTADQYVMYGYWNWPYNNVASPNAGFTANEAVDVLKSTMLVAQPRPTQANKVTSNTFRVG